MNGDALKNLPFDTLLFCGVDMPWEDFTRHGFRRRHSCLLKEFVEGPWLRRVFVLTRVARANYRERVLRRGAASGGGGAKARDVYVTPPLPERFGVSRVTGLNARLMRRQAARQLGPLDPDRTLVWCYWPGGYLLARELDLPGTWLFDADHNIVEDANRPEAQRRGVADLLRESARRVRLYYTGSRSMIRWFNEQGIGPCAYLRNGVEPERFRDRPPPAPVFADLPRPRIGHVGTLSQWIDYDLLIGLARRRPEWTFVLIGGEHGGVALDRLRALPNIVCSGPRSADEIPACLAALDVGLVLYRPDLGPWLDGDSMKVFEYLSMGLPVASTPYHPHVDEDYGGLLRVARTETEMERAIGESLRHAGGADDSWNAARRDFLGKNTWAIRAEEALAAAANLRGAATR